MKENKSGEKWWLNKKLNLGHIKKKRNTSLNDTKIALSEMKMDLEQKNKRKMKQYYKLEELQKEKRVQLQ